MGAAIAQHAGGRHADCGRLIEPGDGDRALFSSPDSQTGHADKVLALIAGSSFGLAATAKTHSLLFYAHLETAPGASAEVPVGHEERTLYVATRAVEIDGRRYEAGRLLVLGSRA